MSYRWKIEVVASSDRFLIEQFLEKHGGAGEACWRAGDPIGKTIRKHKEPGCAIVVSEGDNFTDVDLSLAIKKILPWCQAANKFFGEPQLSIVVRTDGNTYPPLNLTNEIIKTLYLAHISVDIDIIPSL